VCVCVCVCVYVCVCVCVCVCTGYTGMRGNMLCVCVYVTCTHTNTPDTHTCPLSPPAPLQA